jgi:hypothetical protein
LAGSINPAISASKFAAAWLCGSFFWQTLSCGPNCEDPLKMTEQAHAADPLTTADDPAVQPQTNSINPGDQSAERGVARPREIGGREGPEPTRYGDWEMRGRCIDF